MRLFEQDADRDPATLRISSPSAPREGQEQKGKFLSRRMRSKLITCRWLRTIKGLISRPIKALDQRASASGGNHNTSGTYRAESSRPAHDAFPRRAALRRH